MVSLAKDKRMLEYELLNSYSNISHFVTTRYGGCSEGAYSSFNCSPYSGDMTDAVASNQTLLFEEMNEKPKELVIPVQTHGAESLLIDDNYIFASVQQKEEMLNGVDALITDKAGYCLCVSTADCVPVLLYDSKLQVIAAVHAGWRGTVNYIVRDVLLRMKDVFGTKGEDVLACIGPSISCDSFEVGKEVYDAFREKGFDMNRISIWNEKTGKYHIDLWEANRMQLLAFGIFGHHVEISGYCTYIRHHEFFSARRLGIKSGRTLSGIMINGSCAEVSQ